jgi:radical SAM superfamily enzyme YgiQ (UPF0313 family)
MRILLLNPPGKMFYTRDYFCSKVTKAGYAEHPVDLLILSGTLSAAGHSITVIDAIAEGLDFTAASKRIDSLDIDAIIFLSGTVSWKDDFEFLRRIKQNYPKLLLIGLGDIFLSPETFVKNEWIDAVLLDFTSDEILSYLNGDKRNFDTLSFRSNGSICQALGKRSSADFSLALPRYELFLDKGYSFPFAHKLPFATILTDYGCPFNCPFCLYPTLGFKLRKLDNVFEELRYIYDLGIRELFIKDQSFGANKERTIELCEGMRDIGEFSWTCFLRTDIAEEQLLAQMKKSGCHTVLFGVESANEDILKKYKPGITKNDILEAFRLCRSLGIDTVAIFILGFPGEDKKSCLDTVDFALKLKCDFASFNIFVPKVQTPLRKDLLAAHLLDENQPEVLDQSGIASVWHNEFLSQKDLDKLRRLALRKFYIRPTYLLKRLLKSSWSFYGLSILAKSAIFIIGDIIKKKVGNEK